MPFTRVKCVIVKMSEEAKMLIAFFVCGAVIMVAIIIGTTISDQPKQFGDKVCIKVGKELKCEPINES